jgi:hypothetical protein
MLEIVLCWEGYYLSGYVSPMLSGSLVITAWRVLRLRMEEMAYRYGG